MENQVFLHLKEYYEAHQKVMGAKLIKEEIRLACCENYVVEGIVAFKAYLDERRGMDGYD